MSLQYDGRYDAAQIRQDAGRLMATGTVVIALFTILGCLLGAGAGAVFGLAIGSSGLGAIVGLVAGGVVGYLYGDSRALWLRLQAQLALCQVAIEENTRGAVVGGREAPALATPPVTDQAPAPPAPRPATGATPRESFRWGTEDATPEHRCPGCGRRYPMTLAACPGCGRSNDGGAAPAGGATLRP